MKYNFEFIDHQQTATKLLWNDECSKKYENYVFIGDFNVNTSDSSMKEFCSLNGLKNLINEPTYYKNSEKLAPIINRRVCHYLLTY